MRASVGTRLDARLHLRSMRNHEGNADGEEPVPPAPETGLEGRLPRRPKSEEAKPWVIVGSRWRRLPSNKEYQAKVPERLDQYLETLGEHRDQLDKINRLLVKEGDKPEIRGENKMLFTMLLQDRGEANVRRVLT